MTPRDRSSGSLRLQVLRGTARRATQPDPTADLIRREPDELMIPDKKYETDVDVIAAPTPTLEVPGD